MSSDDQTVGQQQPPERPEPTPDDEIVAEREQSHEGLSGINMEPGDRMANMDSIDRLVIEAELACVEGKVLDNPAKPTSTAVGEKLLERLDEHEEELVPAWTRPWEGSDDD